VIEIEWYVMVLVLGVPLILLPVALVWYLNVGGIYSLIKETRQKKTARDEATRTIAEKHPAKT